MHGLRPAVDLDHVRGEISPHDGEVLVCAGRLREVVDVVEIEQLTLRRQPRIDGEEVELVGGQGPGDQEALTTARALKVV